MFKLPVGESDLKTFPKVTVPVVPVTQSSLSVEELHSIHRRIGKDIEDRLAQFGRLGAKGTDDELFTELVFCLLTPQSKARSCWASVECLIDEDLVLSGGPLEISRKLSGVRFHNNKSRYIVEARSKLVGPDGIGMRKLLKDRETPIEVREWLVANIKGMGYKEASHFLRNIGLGQNLAILDRHILKNLVSLGVIEEVPSSMSGKRYLEIEDRMRRFAQRESISMDHLDLVLWYREAGEIFK